MIVFVQNTYYDGVNESEYNASLIMSGTLNINPSALDRFSFMVKKSLSKIDPTYLS